MLQNRTRPLLSFLLRLTLTLLECTHTHAHTWRSHNDARSTYIEVENALCARSLQVRFQERKHAFSFRPQHRRLLLRSLSGLFPERAYGKSRAGATQHLLHRIRGRDAIPEPHLAA